LYSKYIDNYFKPSRIYILHSFLIKEGVEMYFHLIAAILFWIIPLLIPEIPETYMVAIVSMGFIALLLFLINLYVHVSNQFLIKAQEAEKEDINNLPSFKGKFLMIKDEESPLADDFTFMIFHDGSIEIPLFCRNLNVIQKAAKANNDLIIYYKDYILVNVEEIEKTPRP
jgi:predicted membrane protein